MPNYKSYLDAHSAALSFARKVLSDAFSRYSGIVNYTDEDFHVLTPELADRLATMFENTDWKHVSGGPSLPISLPEGLFDEQDRTRLNREALDAHIGETFFFNFKCRPWNGFNDATAFAPGMVLIFLDDVLEEIYDAVDDELCESNLLFGMLLAGQLVHRNGRDIDKAAEDFVDSLPD